MSNFTVQTQVNGETCLLQPNGDLDLASANVLADELAQAASKSDLTKIVVDMSGVPFVDSTGLRILIEGAEKSRQSGIALSLERPSSQFQRLVELTKTDSVLNLG